MPFWKDIYFIDANSPTIEQIIFFHDHSINFIISILIFLLIKIINLILNKIINIKFLENQKIEILWTIIPIIILILIATPSLRLLYIIEEIFNPNLTIKIIGHQWYWTYEYSDFNIKFDSFLKPYSKTNFRNLETDNYLRIPILTMSRLLITRNDVIHSWTIQSLGIKTDAIPRRLNQTKIISNKPGLFYGQCSEICGANHRFIPISLKISTINKFLNYIKSFKSLNSLSLKH